MRLIGHIWMPLDIEAGSHFRGWFCANRTKCQSHFFRFKICFTKLDVLSGDVS